ncbi:MAG: single-stranded DNA-binding protein [bacterium]|nr:single-stranded DNA-binding protein [bacterium]
MKNIAQVHLDGNLTADPETKSLNNERGERVLTSFRVAANHEWNQKDGNKAVSYFSVECWGKLAENSGRYLRKGDHVTLIGDLRQDRWLDAEGQPRQAVKVVARYVRFDSIVPKKSTEASDKNADRDTNTVAAADSEAVAA